MLNEVMTMGVKVGSCFFVKCKHQDENGECLLDLNDGSGTIIMCNGFEYDGDYDD